MLSLSFCEFGFRKNHAEAMNSNNIMKTKFFLYARKSTEDEDRQIMSIEAQITELTDYANCENIIIAEKFIESKSTKKPGPKFSIKWLKKIYASRKPVGILV